MELKLLKEGEVGYGLLVEKDSGFISPQLDQNKKTSKFYRYINEIPTLLLILIVFIVVFKPI